MKSPDFTALLSPNLRSLLRVLGQHFMRRGGLLGPSRLFLILVTVAALERGTIGRAIQALAALMPEELGWAQVAPPSCSAFSQARRHLLPALCLSAFAAIRKALTAARRCPRAQWYGMRVLSFDGTRLNLPISSALKKHFGCPKQGGQVEAPCPQAGFILLWDILAHQPVAWELGRYNLAERTGATTLLPHVGPGDVVVADRGFPGFAFFQAIRERGAHYIIRMNTKTISLSREFADFMASGAMEATVTFQPFVNRHRRFPGDKPMRIRFVRDPKSPDRILATSLCSRTFTAKRLWACYAKRWDIETAIREAKQWRGLEAFRAKFVNGIHQEVTAIMTNLHLISELEVPLRKRGIKKEAETKPNNTACPFSFNHRQLGDLTMRWLASALLQSAVLLHIIKRSLEYIWRHRERRRFGRSFPRICKSPRGLRRRDQKPKKVLKKKVS